MLFLLYTQKIFGFGTAVSFLLLSPSASAWILPIHQHGVRSFKTYNSNRRRLQQQQQQQHSMANNDHHHEEWSVTDDWNQLSDADNQPANSDVDFLNMPSLDAASIAALRMQNFGMNVHTRGTLTKEEEWLEEALDGVLAVEESQQEKENNNETPSSLSKQPGSASATKPLDTERFLDSMGDEIAMLVRCNQDPRQMLIAQGRAVAELTDEERYDVRQLVERVVNTDGSKDDDAVVDKSPNWKATPFFREACANIFRQHCSPQDKENDDDDDDALLLLDKAGVARWMNQCLTDETIGRHDRRVTKTLARYGRGGTMTLDNFVQMYVAAVTGDDDGDDSPIDSFHQLERHRAPEIQAVWRDIHQHGIVSPAEWDRDMKLAEIKAQYDALEDDNTMLEMNMNEYTILDECELLTEDEETSLTTDRHGKGSYEHVELVPSSSGAAKKVPVWIRDGEFVFIDEQSCIGCMQCATTAPASFQMIEHSGRARTFFQRNSPDVKSAVKSCPVDCMHYVSFDELQELETARDDGVADDHRHFGGASARGYIAPTPLHVSRRSSDSNHKSSFYHYLRNKCCASTNCPERGCYDCPRYSQPGSNPYFQKRLAKANHLRAQFFISTGQADSFRKTAEL